MRYEKSITVNLGNFNSMKVGVIEANDLETCDEQIVAHIKRRFKKNWKQLLEDNTMTAIGVDLDKFD
jgi:hypothetical protein